MNIEEELLNLNKEEEWQPPEPEWKKVEREKENANEEFEMKRREEWRLKSIKVKPRRQTHSYE